MFIPHDECDYLTYGNRLNIPNKGHYRWEVEYVRYSGEVIKKHRYIMIKVVMILLFTMNLLVFTVGNSQK